MRYRFVGSVLVVLISYGAGGVPCGSLTYCAEREQLVLVNRDVALGRQVLLLGYRLCALTDYCQSVVTPSI